MRGISFDVNQGEVLGIVGESGSGKSVTSLSIMGLLQHPGRVVDGEIFFQDQDILSYGKRRMRRVRGKEIAMIFQDPMTSLNPVYTVGNQIMEMLQEHEDIGKGEAKRRAIEMLRMVGIPSPEKRIHNYPHEFSGGMRQRAMIAIALACSPKLLIADEPTTALDVTIQAQILKLMDKEAGHRHAVDHPRPGRGGHPVRQGGGDVRRADYGGRHGGGDLLPPEAPIYHGSD